MIGGAEKACFVLARYFVEHNYSVTILTQKNKGLPSEEILEGVHVHRKISYFGIYWISYIITSLFYLITRRDQYNCILLFGLYLTLPPSIIVARLFKKRVILRLEGSGKAGDLNRMKKIKGGKLVRACLPFVDKIIAVSMDIQKDLKRIGQLKKAVYLPNFVDSRMFTPCNTKAEQMEGKLVLFIGRLSIEKGVDIFLDAIARLRKKTKFKVSIIGTGYLINDLLEKTNTLGISKIVSFEGQKGNVIPYLYRADVFVLPSRSEGMSIALLEAMACGLPVVVTDVSGTRDVVEDGVNGLVVPPENEKLLADAIGQLLTNKDIALRMGQQARRTIEEKFSLNMIGKQYKEILC